MKISVIHLDVKPDKLGEFKNVWDKTAESVRGKYGLVDVALLSHTDGKFLAFGVWENEEMAAKWPSQPIYQQFLAAISPLILSPPKRALYDLVSGQLSIAGTEIKAA